MLRAIGPHTRRGVVRGSTIDIPRGAANFAMLWVTDTSGQLKVIPVRTGISDGTATEVEGPGLEEGMQVIAGLNQAGAAGGTVNPFQGGGGGGFRPGGF